MSQPPYKAGGTSALSGAVGLTQTVADQSRTKWRRSNAGLQAPSSSGLRGPRPPGHPRFPGLRSWWKLCHRAAAHPPSSPCVLGIPDHWRKTKAGDWLGFFRRKGRERQWTKSQSPCSAGAVTQRHCPPGASPAHPALLALAEGAFSPLGTRAAPTAGTQLGFGRAGGSQEP